MSEVKAKPFVDYPSYTLQLYGGVWDIFLQDIQSHLDWIIGNCSSWPITPDDLGYSVGVKHAKRAFRKKNIEQVVDCKNELTSFSAGQGDKEQTDRVHELWGVVVHKEYSSITLSVVERSDENGEVWIRFKQFAKAADERFGGRYTNVFKLPRSYIPLLYTGGIIAGPLARYGLKGTGPIPKIDLRERITEWRRRSSAPDFEIEGPLSDIHPLAILSKQHLDYSPNGEDLKSAIKRLNAGALKELRPGRWTWEIDEAELREVRFEFIELGFTVYQGDPELRDIRP
jgi:hypothetical protein